MGFAVIIVTGLCIKLEAGMPSFDIVSEIDHHELTNAVDQTNREITQRYDLKNTSAVVKQEGTTLHMTGDAEFHLQQIMDILLQKMTKRGIDIQCLEEGKVEGAGKAVKQDLTVREGMDQLTAKKIVKMIKDAKLKVQAAVQGEKIRVTGKKRDDLQEVMALLRSADLGLPLQYNNFRD
jgi:cyclic-di-GMP-binding protein